MTEVLVHFTADFDYRPSYDPLLTIAYTRGMEVEVDAECADRAVALGCAMFPVFLEDELMSEDDED